MGCNRQVYPQPKPVVCEFTGCRKSVIKTNNDTIIDVFIQGNHKGILTDTDASLSLVQSCTAKAPLCLITQSPHVVTGDSLHVLGTQAI